MIRTQMRIRTQIRMWEAVPIALLLLTWPATAAERFSVPLDLQPVVPDLPHLDPAVQEDLLARRDRVARGITHVNAPRAELGEAWGALGMWYQVYRYFDRARRAYTIAERLMPGESRWPYYLAHIQARQADFNAAVDSYRRAIERRPDYVPSLVRLAELEFKSSREREVAGLLDRALAIDPGQPRALVLRAQMHMSNDRFEAALLLLERALERDPRGSQIHYLLGIAHRRLGNGEKAQQHLAAWETARGASVQTMLDDPLMTRLEQVGKSTQNKQNQGIRALAEGRSQEAIALHRQAVAADPENMIARVNLGVTLFQTGDPAAAIATFEEILRIHPSAPPHPELALTHFGLAAVLESEGRLREAEEQCRQSLRSDPDQLEANLLLARLLVRNGRGGESETPFARVIARDPANPNRRLERSQALMRSGRYVRAAELLNEDLEAVPADPLLQISLARLLAATPADGLRDGARAIELARFAHRRAPSVASAETLAMSYAERNDFSSATRWQRVALDAMKDVRTAVDPHWVADRLAGYVRGEPCREPWSPAEAITLKIPLPN